MNETNTTENTENTNNDSATPETTGEQQQPQQQQEPTPTNEGEDKLRAQIARLEADNRKLKDENAGRRVTAKTVEEQNAKLRDVARVLGLANDEEDPEELLKAAKQEAAENAKERDALQAKLNRLEEGEQLRNVVERAGGDPRFLVPYLRGVGLPEWGSDEWESKVTELVGETMERYDNARVRTAPRSSGNAPTPTGGGSDTVTREDLQRLAANGDWEEINKLSEKLRR